MKIDFSIIEEKDRDLINTLLQFESYDLCKVFKNDLNEHGRYISKLEESLLQDYYDQDDDEDYKGYRIK